ncbi:family 12 glycoside hydrolase [Circinella umbellata]|nr:family 12 glycoside hydrolase [Circinella umbellata]
MKWASITSALLLASTATFALPTTKRATELCGQWDTEEIGDYIVYNNAWNQDKGTGSQCTQIKGLNNNELAWSSAWSWDGTKYDVKTYPNAKYKPLAVKPKQLSSISSIPFKWNWTYKGDNLITDVAFDLWTAPTVDGDLEFEIMIWLAAIGGAGPLGNQVGTFDYGGTSWKLYEGSNGSQTVYSFIAGNTIEKLSSDALPFLQHLVKSGYIAGSQYLRDIQAGTEPFIGSNAVFETTAYTVTVK